MLHIAPLIFKKHTYLSHPGHCSGTSLTLLSPPENLFLLWLVSCLISVIWNRFQELVVQKETEDFLTELFPRAAVCVWASSAVWWNPVTEVKINSWCGVEAPHSVFSVSVPFVRRRNNCKHLIVYLTDVFLIFPSQMKIINRYCSSDDQVFRRSPHRHLLKTDVHTLYLLERPESN